MKVHIEETNELGWSAHTYTNALGRFGWRTIPVQRTPYYQEGYWGPRLIYRQLIMVMGPLSLPQMHI